MTSNLDCMLRKYENFASSKLLQLRVLPGHPQLTSSLDFCLSQQTEHDLQKKSARDLFTWGKLVGKYRTVSIMERKTT